MEKKKYIVPQMITVELKTRCSMLDASSVRFGGTYSGEPTAHRSRESFWDDDDDYEE